PVVHTFHALGAVKARHQGPADTSPAARIGVERALLGLCDHVVATCRDEVAELVAMGGCPARVSVVPCGVDTELFSPRRTPRRPGRRRVVTVGRMVPRKGGADLIRAMASVPGAELVVVGG